MPDFPYLIVGGGMTAAAAVEGILEHEPGARIGMIGDEPHPPYNRPPLSKGLWKGKPLEGIWRKVPVENVTMHLGRRAVTLDLERKVVRDDNGVDYRYGRLLLATGGRRADCPMPPSRSSTSVRWTTISGCGRWPTGRSALRSSAAGSLARRLPRPCACWGRKLSWSSLIKRSALASFQETSPASLPISIGPKG